MTMCPPSSTQDLTKVPGFEEATVKNLTTIREQGALAAYKSCL